MFSKIINLIEENHPELKFKEFNKFIREENTNIWQITFTCKTTCVYFMRVDFDDNTILTFHKNERKQDRDPYVKIKNEFWKKWNPNQFCDFNNEEALKVQLMSDLDKVIKNHKGRLSQLDLTKFIKIKKGLYEREL